ncbi:DNA adenine methylase [Clostridium disporicum]|uniref:DNA adenine methylase n=1 Tax=Clostridium disporicum TaxID=84024 RepID=UPI0034A3BFF5
MSYIKSPLNYMGGKYKLLPQIIPLFPQDIKTFVDLFGGGFNVGINVDCERVIYNDTLLELSELFEHLYFLETNDILHQINEVILEYNNLETDDDYYQLRTDYNQNKSWNKLFVLMSYGFNYLIRFNNKGEYNIPSGVGKSSFSERGKSKLLYFKEVINKKIIHFTSVDFRNFDINKLSVDDFVYIDPPYLISNATYNRNWTEKEEVALLEFLDELNSRNIRFALSNVIEHKGLINKTLLEWSKNYHTTYLNANYYTFYSNKELKSKSNQTVEVLITNYIPNVKEEMKVKSAINPIMLKNELSIAL